MSADERSIAGVASVLLYPREDGKGWASTREAAEWLRERGIAVILPKPLCTSWRDRPEGALLLRRNESRGRVDLVIALGGDGTLLRASRWAAAIDVPVVGVNLGDLGFLSAFGGDQISECLEAVVGGHLRWEPRLRMRVEVRRDGQVLTSDFACNDAYIKHGDNPRLLSLTTEVGGQVMANYKADGLIICTPMGSTAYNLAAGGPIVGPGTEVLTITPICPHSLTHRPVVVAAGAEILITYAGPADTAAAFLTVDGQRSVALQLGDVVAIACDPPPLKLVPPDHNVFHVLATKLGWSGPR
ncbi:MAG: NAD(+)/NADH kinase [Myxococcales bacterium]|nr:NAD(+)/NADH kinase [Myxococcales bacterium]MCB9705291.1 NAD(+)/NADH kinase [Myxococcales bacterium]